jgi:hypothetical protein
MLVASMMERALDDVVLYPNGRVTSAYAGYTRNGQHSHIAVYDEKRHETHTLCGLVAEGRMVWYDRSNISCRRCHKKAEAAGCRVGRRFHA